MNAENEYWIFYYVTIVIAIIVYYLVFNITKIDTLFNLIVILTAISIVGYALVKNYGTIFQKTLLIAISILMLISWGVYSKVLIASFLGILLPADMLIANEKEFFSIPTLKVIDSFYLLAIIVLILVSVYENMPILLDITLLLSLILTGQMMYLNYKSYNVLENLIN
ncbi:hypothetical protein [Methanobrevibacter filiformis]|uniref:Uncharacterized protein n=1 Tax=Methanobrevibacter filiformis TaxID=55758 RepID=A0A165Z9Q7_9EURY|nr:hypothetical protein [Methanobrevibacter filiformis]KZX10444.1 hypothetical protein MBFIL_17430 [Methanobrevibacter filiformis]